MIRQVTLGVFAIIGVVMAGCSDASYTQINFPMVPIELKDCKFYRLTNSSGTGMTIARCPNSTTAVVDGRQMSVTSSSNDPVENKVTINGITYKAIKETK